VHQRHTGETIFNTFAKAMDALFPDWRETITGASSDGEKKMTRHGDPHGNLVLRCSHPHLPQIHCA
jgi:hypothetical protein